MVNSSGGHPRGVPEQRYGQKRIHDLLGNNGIIDSGSGNHTVLGVHFIQEKGRGTSVRAVQKALCSCLKITLIFHKKMVGNLESHGLEIIPNDPYVANKKVEGKRLMIMWNVDDLKIYHIDRKVVSSTILWLD